MPGLQTASVRTDTLWNGTPMESGIMHRLARNIQLRNAGFNSVVMGTSQTGTFKDKLESCGKTLGLKAHTQTIEPPKHAKDEGVDIVGGFIWGDGRIGEPLWLVQAACGRHRRLEKIREVDPAKWALYLAIRTNPMVFLAVPYHLTEEAVDKIVPYEGSKSFMDRLRLVRMLGQSIDFEAAKLLGKDREVKAKAYEFFGMPA